jgi:hypothetical protein
MKKIKLLALLLCLYSSVHAQPKIEYKSVSEAFSVLKANKRIEMRNINGQIMATDDTNHIIWAFVPKESPIYPSVVKMTVSENIGNDGLVSIKRDLLCEAKKERCDKFLDDLVKADQKVRESFKK